MDMLEGIFTRRSIRKYTDKTVSDEDIHILLKAAMLAPSAVNQRPWHFVVVRNEEIRKKLSTASPYAKMAEHAPLVIIICGDIAKEKAPGLWVQDCSAATENLLLAARAINLGSVWCAVYPEKDRMEATGKILNLPEKIIPLNMICIGHPAQQFTEADRYMPERVHMEGWQ